MKDAWKNIWEKDKLKIFIITACIWNAASKYYSGTLTEEQDAFRLLDLVANFMEAVVIVFLYRLIRTRFSSKNPNTEKE